ncbi:MAG: hypothetical protein Q8922_04565 [Bacteroidota bacterium]|nr:hypothetical protein [Bacteroidota bacterium]MDP4231854.1 hypothetical protein [Bacteroidota bacterium]MDP4242740.1 hypothetical protein [Bacteroidota bacterium]MDP4287191.1 hypothetical protein [Bacteroidota bacterium]
MKTRIPLRLLALAALLLALAIPASKSFAQTSIGNVDVFGNWVLTYNNSTLEAAFTDELNSGSDTTVYNATFTSVSIVVVGGIHYLVAEGSNSGLASVVAKVPVAQSSGYIYLDGSQDVTCSCEFGDCGSGCILCPCPTSNNTLVGGAGHLGNFY